VPRNNHEHAIFASGMHDGEFVDNLVWEYADRGFQGSAAPRDVLVSGNVFAGGDHAGMHTNAQASGVLMRNNVSTNNGSFNFYAGPRSRGSGNGLSGNCFDDDAPVRLDPSVSGSNNTTVDEPGFGSSLKDGVVKVTNPACAAKLPAGSRFK
jgi:hypothetical protein